MLTEIDRLYNANEVRELDRIAIQEAGTPGIVLMKRAGGAVFKVLTQLYPECRSIALVCGKGNNAGDGYIIAGLARQRGMAVSVYQLGSMELLSGDAATAMGWALAQGVQPQRIETTQTLELTGEVIVDALLGTGISGEVRQPYHELITLINRRSIDNGVKVIAVDVPSGLSADSGQVLGCAVRADVTVTFIGAKRGLFTAAGPAYAGEVILDDLDVAPDVISRVPGIPALHWNKLAAAVPHRSATAYKHACGHLVVCGGDRGMGGAVAMAAETALRVGTGMVTVLTREAHVPALLARRPELMVRGWEAGESGDAILERASAVVVGPGLGRSDWSKALLQQAIAAGKPLLIDADGLNLLAQGVCRSSLANSSVGLVITPHSGEAARLLKRSSGEVESDRFGAILSLSECYGAVCVLKGPGTLVAEVTSGDSCASAPYLGLCMHGNPAMATAGMGDVLSGVIGGFLAQGLSPADAARIGVCLHSAAADQWVAAEGERGLLATDLVAVMRQMLNRTTSSE